MFLTPGVKINTTVRWYSDRIHPESGWMDGWIPWMEVPFSKLRLDFILCLILLTFTNVRSLCLVCPRRIHDPDTRILHLLKRGGVPRGMERRQEPPLHSHSSLHQHKQIWSDKQTTLRTSGHKIIPIVFKKKSQTWWVEKNIFTFWDSCIRRSWFLFIDSIVKQKQIISLFKLNIAVWSKVDSLTTKPLIKANNYSLDSFQPNNFKSP